MAEAKELLTQRGLAADSTSGVYNFYTCGDPELFAGVGTIILGCPIDKAEKVIFG